MRISAFPKAFLGPMIVDRTMSVLEWIELATSLPVDGLELHAEFFWDGTDDEIERVGDALDRSGFEMPMLCVSPDFTNPDAAVRSREFDRQLAAVDIAARLGPVGRSNAQQTDGYATCRVLSGQAHPDVSIDQGLEWASDAINALIPIARERGVVLCLENHYKASTWQYPEFAQRPEVFQALLDRIPERYWFGVQYDPSNALVAGLDSAQFLTTVIDRVMTMQASDRYLADGASLEALRQADGTIGYSPDLLHGVIGRGLNDYDRIFRVLVEAGYDGWISIEDGVNGLDEMRESAEYLQRARDDFFGGSHEVRVRSRERVMAPSGDDEGENAMRQVLRTTAARDGVAS